MAECSIRSLTALGFDLDAPRFQSPALFRAFVRENVITIPAAPRNTAAWDAAFDALRGAELTPLGIGRMITSIGRNSPQAHVEACRIILREVGQHLPLAMRRLMRLRALWPTLVLYIQPHPDSHAAFWHRAVGTALLHVAQPCVRLCCRRWRKGGLRAHIVRVRPLRGPPDVFVDILVHANGAYMLSPELAEVCTHEVLWSGDAMEDVVAIYELPPNTDVAALFRAF